MKDTEQKRGRATRFTVTGEWGNAKIYGEDKHRITHGDTCVVKVGAPYSDGDLVLIECSCGYSDAPHHHALYYRVCHGKLYKFRLPDYPQTAGGRLCKEGDEKIIVGPVVKVIKKGKRETKQKGRATHETRISGFDWPYYDIHDNDELTVETSGAAPIGKLVLLKSSTKKGHEYFNRVCGVSGDIVRVCNQTGESHDEPRNLVIGPVVEIKHDNCVAVKLAALRAKLAKLQDDDEHTLNHTKCFEVEQEIYELEHPPETEEDAGEGDEWPDVIGEGGV